MRSKNKKRKRPGGKPSSAFRIWITPKRRSCQPTFAGSQRSYRHAIDEFVGWYCSEPRLSFNKTVVTR